MSEKHDIHDFLISAQRDMHDEYTRILKRAKEDPGTAGDQGEENWAALLREWLPGYFHIVTKGRILCENGYASPQIDLLVLHPSYPKALLDKKLYLAGGVAAAFECKITLESDHVKKAVETAALIRENLSKREGTPYKELNSSIVYGLLAHSHSWKADKSKPVENIDKALLEADKIYVKHPIQQLDFITVSDLATWEAKKMVYTFGEDGSAATSHIVSAIGTEQQKDYFTPISALVSGLFTKLGWTFTDMRELEEYFRKVNMLGSGEGKMRMWPISIYSEGIRERIYKGQLSNGVMYDEWSIAF